MAKVFFTDSSQSQHQVAAVEENTRPIKKLSFTGSLPIMKRACQRISSHSNSCFLILFDLLTSLWIWWPGQTLGCQNTVEAVRKHIICISHCLFAFPIVWGPSERHHAQRLGSISNNLKQSACLDEVAGIVLVQRDSS